MNHALVKSAKTYATVDHIYKSEFGEALCGFPSGCVYVGDGARTMCKVCFKKANEVDKRTPLRLCGDEIRIWLADDQS